MSNIKQTIVNKDLVSIAENATLVYGTEVVMNRAVPDYRDGLKPVQRAILWSMYKQHMLSNAAFKKSAKIVGDVLGSWHPHGESATYQAAVGMVNSLYPTIDGYGNWGSHVDEAAAPRYCFVAGTKIMTEFGLVNIEKIPKYCNIDGKPEQCETEYKLSSTDFGATATKWLYSGKQDTIILTTKNGYSVQCTRNQPLLVLDKNLNYVWKIASTFEVGDHVILSGGYIDYLMESKFENNLLIMFALFCRAVVRKGKYVTYKDVNRDRISHLKMVIPECYLESCSIEENEVGKYTLHCTFKDYTLTTLFGVVDWNEYTSYVPEAIMRCSYDDMLIFFRGICLLFLRVDGLDVTIKTRSRNLCLDLKMLLLSYFNILTSDISEIINGYVNFSILDIDVLLDSGFLPKTFESIIIKETDLKKHETLCLQNRRIPNVKNWINTQYLEALYSDKHTEDTLQKIRSLSDHSVVLRNQLNLGIMEENYITDKLSIIIDNDFHYEEIFTVEEGGLQHTFDLTVDKTHAFTANGFLAHNTEARLTEFAENFLLDPEYLSVVEMQKNYSEDQHLPTVLPAKVPNFLLMDNTSIAVGISASSPSFDLKGVLDLTKLYLSGKRLTPELCLKHLKLKFLYGGDCISDKDTLLEFYKTGKGTLHFVPKHELHLDKREFLITSTCPGLTTQTSISKLLLSMSMVSGVKRVYDAADKDGIRYVVQFGKIGDVKIKEAVAQILPMLKKSESYDLGAVLRSVDKTVFMRVTPTTLIEKWCAWRVELEIKVLSNRLINLQTKIDSVNATIFAINNLNIIIEALSKDDSVKYLISKLKITEEQANVIMNLKVYQLKKFSKKKLLDDIKGLNTQLKNVKELKKNPVPVIVRELEKVQSLKSFR